MTQPRILALDSNILIIAVESDTADPDASACRTLVFEREPDVVFVVSEILLAEVLVRPLREGNLELARFYRRLLTDLRSFRMVPVTRSVLLEAARLRSASRLKLADAIHLATAVRQGCKALVTLDAEFASSGSVAVLGPTAALEFARR